MSHGCPGAGEAMALRDALIHGCGGALGICEEGAKHSAIVRPQLGCYDSLIEEAAARPQSQASIDPFVDGSRGGGREIRCS